MNRAVLVLSLSSLFISSWGCHKCSSCQDPNQNATQGGGGGGGSGADPLAGGDWYVVMPQDAAHSVKVDLKSIQMTLRHSRMSTTADVYAHVLEEVQRQAANQMDGVLRDLGATR